MKYAFFLVLLVSQFYSNTTVLEGGDKTIEWKPGQLLKWQDFQGTKPMGSDGAAKSVISIKID